MQHCAIPPSQPGIRGSSSGLALLVVLTTYLILRKRPQWGVMGKLFLFVVVFVTELTLVVVCWNVFLSDISVYECASAAKATTTSGEL